MTDVFFCKLEYWDPSTGDWTIGHRGVNLLHPRGYAERLAKNGKVGRVTVYARESAYEVEEVIQILDTPAVASCNFCDETHPGPYDGSCLI